MFESDSTKAPAVTEDPTRHQQFPALPMKNPPTPTSLGLKQGHVLNAISENITSQNHTMTMYILLGSAVYTPFSGKCWASLRQEAPKAAWALMS